MNENQPLLNDTTSRRGFFGKAAAWAAGTAAAAAVVNALTPSSAKAAPLASGDSELMGAISLSAMSFAPMYYAFCIGQTVQIAQYSALYSLLGTTFGGDGRTNFNLPDLRNRFPIGTWGSYALGATGGGATVTLAAANMPFHNHQLAVNSGVGNSDSPTGTYPAANGEGIRHYATTSNASAAAAAVSGFGGNTPFSIMPPFIAMHYIIATEGLYPTRP